MDARTPPPFYDDLEASLAEAWRRLVRGAADRRAPFHTPVLATLRPDRPGLRTVVLRAADPATPLLRVHTDRRSAKVAELAACPRAALLFYDAPARLQLRLDVDVQVAADGAAADAAWAASAPASRACYRVSAAPGTPLATPQAPPEHGDGRDRFAALLCTPTRLEWLFLWAGGHRRATFAPVAGNWRGAWLVP